MLLKQLLHTSTKVSINYNATMRDTGPARLCRGPLFREWKKEGPLEWGCESEVHFWSDLIWRQDSGVTVNPLQCSKVSWLVYLLRCFDIVSARLNDKAVFFFLWNSRAYANVHTHRNLPCERTILTEMKRSLMLEKETIQVKWTIILSAWTSSRMWGMRHQKKKVW